MHNLKTNYDKFFQLINKTLPDLLLIDGNFKPYPRKPTLSDNSILALTLCAEALSIDSENYFWSKLKTDHASDFPKLIDRSNFNRRKKNLAPYLTIYNQRLANAMNEFEDTFIVDSMPIPICNIARADRITICKENFQSAADKGYSSITKSYFMGYKLHLVTSVRGVFHSMQLSKASVHDIHYLEEIKDSGLNNCLLLGDKGYLGSEQKTDLFHTAKIELQTPCRANQLQQTLFPYVFKKCRKRIETQFSQLCDQFMIKRNYAKTYTGLTTRILSKIVAFTSLQLLNFTSGKSLNKIKHALAA
jgi:hypothetical protein